MAPALRTLGIVVLAVLLFACAHVGVQTPTPAVVHSSPRAAAMRVFPASWSVPNWYVDNQNVTGCASDGNTCQSATCASGGVGPCRTFMEIALARWGTWLPTHSQATMLEFLSDDTSEDILWTPHALLNNGVDAATISIQCPLGTAQTVAAGAITVTAQPTNTALLTVTLPSATYSPGLLVINATHSSYAWVETQISGNTWTVTQPLTGTGAPAFAGGPFPAYASWTTGDSVSVYREVQVNASSFGPYPDQVLPSLDDYAFWYHCDDYNPDTTFNIETLRLGQLVDVNESRIDRIIQYTDASVNLRPFWQNNWLRGGATGDGNAYPSIYGGAIGVHTPELNLVELAGTILDLNVVIGQAFSVVPPTMSQGHLGQLFLEGSSTVLTIAGDTDLNPNYSGNISGSVSVRGTGIVNVIGSSRLSYTGATASSIFLNSGGLQINGSSSARTVAASGSYSGSISLTPGNLDLAVGSGGFGGLAINPGGASIASGSF